MAWNTLKREGNILATPDTATTVLFGGDVTFDREHRSYRGRYYLRSVKAGRHGVIIHKMKRIFDKLFLSPSLRSSVIDVPYEELVRYSGNEKEDSGNDKTALSFNIDCISDTSKYEYPFEGIASFLKTKDIVVINLETPLSETKRTYGFFKSDPRYAKTLKDSGISLVSLANNHMFDAGETGLLDTISHLNAAGVSFTGGGMNLDNARSGKLLTFNDTRFIFLSYTHFCNSDYTSAAGDDPGILPMDIELMLEDVKTARDKAHLVFVSLHWGYENQPNIHPKQIELAHLLIDRGVDCVVGHHPHVPHGIEIYKKRPILYSLGNFIFPYCRKMWSDNFLAEIVIDQKRIKGIKIYPVSGKGQELFQPRLLTGARAASLLRELQIKSLIFDTAITVRDNIGYIEVEHSLSPPYAKVEN